MNTTGKIKEALQTSEYDAVFKGLYTEEKTEYQKKRYIDAVLKYEEIFGCGEVAFYSVPGRSEIGGNHTDHQNGKILAAAVDVDVIAAAGVDNDNVARVFSEGYGMLEVNLDSLEPREDEYGTTIALVKGVLHAATQRGFAVGGFQAYVKGDVPAGSGISSSAAFEVLMALIVSDLYNEGKFSAEELAKIGKIAENMHFGKPCGLMDQMVCAVGSLVHIDFADDEKPVVEKIDCDLNTYGYVMCITDTKGSHADLTAEFAAIPAEMKEVAGFFGKDVLRDVSVDDLLGNCSEIRKSAGDRAFLRAFHFVNESVRAAEEADALKTGDFGTFLKIVKNSGDSSYKYLQNIYSPDAEKHQNISVALAVSEAVLGDNGAARVHGGGFAGTVQAFVKKEAADDYRKNMDAVFGKNACTIYKIRRQGAVKVM